MLPWLGQQIAPDQFLTCQVTLQTQIDVPITAQGRRCPPGKARALRKAAHGASGEAPAAAADLFLRGEPLPDIQKFPRTCARSGVLVSPAAKKLSGALVLFNDPMFIHCDSVYTHWKNVQLGLQSVLRLGSIPGALGTPCSPVVDQRHDPSWWGGGHREAGLTVSFPVVPSLKSHLGAGCPAKCWDAAMQGGIGRRGGWKPCT